ncbi:MFS-type transporter-like protein 20 [Elsinoe fawcettii]|nr:MFS-type transporter-like protein 20 [Elsinoe fawcettii]
MAHGQVNVQHAYLTALPFDGVPGATTSLDYEQTSEVPVEDQRKSRRKSCLLVFGSFCIVMSTWGLVNSVGVFQSWWLENQLRDYSASSVGWITSTFIASNMSLAVAFGPLFDRFGSRWLLVGGSTGYILAFFILGSCSQFWHFILTFSLLGGISSAMLSIPAIGLIRHGFDESRGLATGIATMGAGAGGVMFPMVLRVLLEDYGWGWATRILAFMITFLVVVGDACLLVTHPPKGDSSASTFIVDLSCFQDSRFIWATIAYSSFEFIFASALGLLPVYAMMLNFSQETSFALIAALNAGSTVFRWIPGILSDRIGTINTVTGLYALTAVVVLAVWFPFGTKTPALFTAVVALGACIGSLISLAPVCIGRLCAMESFGRWLGMCYFVASIL